MVNIKNSPVKYTAAPIYSEIEFARKSIKISATIAKTEPTPCVTFIGVFGPSRLKWLHFPLYFILGWSALIFVPKMITDNLAFFFWILGGGVIYTLGIIPFAIDKKVSHFLWHFFVLAGAVVQWVGIYLFIYCV